MQTIRRIGLKWMGALMLAAAGLPAAHAQLPEGCLSADSARAGQYLTRAADLVARGEDFAAVRGLLHEMESGFSKGCQAALAREQPTRTRCTAAQRETLMVHQVAMIRAIDAGDVQRFLGLFDQMEAAVSGGCWLATNQPQEPLVRKTCTTAEMDVMAAHVAPALRATMRMLETNDMGPVLQVARSQNERLSEACRRAIELSKPKPHERRPPVPLPDIHDLGGGTLMGPGVACNPRECTVY